MHFTETGAGISSPHLPDHRLMLRTATLADAEAVINFNATTVHPTTEGMPNARIAERTRSFFDGNHPIVRPDDFTLVIDQEGGRIASSMVMIRQMWLYDGIPFSVGQFEFVGTDPDYRRQGLIRRQFDMLHQRAAEQGQLLQAINGIPWFYRQFGYEYALDMGGSRAALRSQVEEWSRADSGNYQVRSATPADIPLLMQLYTYPRERAAISVRRDEAMWQYELMGRHLPNIYLRHHCILETKTGGAIGHFAYASHLPWLRFGIDRYELLPGHSWAETTPALLRFILSAPEMDTQSPLFTFWLSTSHPVYQAYAKGLSPITPANAWYIRIPDLAAFLQQIAPALEQRLAQSPLCGYSGELTLNFYRNGLSLHFSHGQIAQIEAWRPPYHREPGPSFPNQTFLMLLLGHRSLDELLAFYPDCLVEHDLAYALLNSIFPKCPSLVWEIG